MNIYHRIISSVYLRVPRHLFWCAAIFFSLPRPMLGATLARSCCCCPCLLRSGLWQRTHSSICRTYAGRLCQAVDWRGAVAAPLLLAPRHGPRRHRGIHTFDSVTAAIRPAQRRLPGPGRPIAGACSSPSTGTALLLLVFFSPLRHGSSWHRGILTLN